MFGEFAYPLVYRIWLNFSSQHRANWQPFCGYLKTRADHARVFSITSFFTTNGQAICMVAISGNGTNRNAWTNGWLSILISQLGPWPINKAQYTSLLTNVSHISEHHARKTILIKIAATDHYWGVHLISKQARSSNIDIIIVSIIRAKCCIVRKTL